jgi:TolB-like protein
MQTLGPDGRTALPSLRPAPGEEEARAQLQRILTSGEFPGAGRSGAFLSYVVEEVLAGRGNRIKGYSVAVEVFKRDEAFTQDDPVVRIEAGRLRRSLERYYLTAGHFDPIRIVIPKGGYVPEFLWAEVAGPAPGDGNGPELGTIERLTQKIGSLTWSRWLVAGICAISISTGLAVAVWTVRQPGADARPATGRPSALPDGPSLVIAPFANLGEGPNAELYTQGLTEELLTALPRFREIKVFGRETSKSLPPEVGATRIRGELGARYLLAGGVRVSDNRVRVTARLLDTASGAILWSQTYDDDLRTRQLFVIQSDVANKVATAVAQPYGIMAQADVANPPPDDLGAYACTLSYYAYRAELSVERHAKVRGCLEQAVADHPSFATAWAMLSTIYLDEDRFKFNRKADASAPIERSLLAARRAIQLDPGSTRALQALMTALFFNEKLEEALQVGEQALATNPNDTELLAEFGTRLAMGGDWQRGADLLDRALALNPGGAGYYHGNRALAAFMLHDEKTAVAEIQQADLQKFPLFHAVAAVVYADAGMMEEARREGEQFVRMRPDFMPNVVAELNARNFQPKDQARMIAAARKAGLNVSEEAQAAITLAMEASGQPPR